MAHRVSCFRRRMLYASTKELKEWVRVAAGWDKIGRYTIEQLRAVKKILEG